MSEEQAADVTDGPAVIEWGGAGAVRRRPWPGPARILRNRWLAPLVAGLGAVAVFASFVGEWATLTIPDFGGPGENVPLTVTRRVSDMGAVGAAYLVGVLALVGTVTLVLFGALSAHRNARLIGLATAGGLLAILVAHATLDEVTENMFLFGPEISIQIEHSHGLVMAYVGTAALGLALVLAGWFAPTPPADGAAVHATEPANEIDWPWRRPQRAADAVLADGDEPLDLTVGPARPFTLPDQTDRP